MPIVYKNNTFVSIGCQAHNCSSTNFILVVDFTKDVLYAGISEEDKIKVFSEDGSSSSEIKEWADHY